MLYIKEINDRKGKLIFSFLLIFILILLLTFLKNYTINILKKLDFSQIRKLPLNSIYLNPIINKLENDFDFYVYSQWLGKNFIQFMFLFSIMFSFSIFSKERENKTIYYLLSIFSRDKIYHTKVLVSYISFILITVVGVFASFIPYLFYNKTPLLNYLLFIPTIIAFFSLIFFIEILISIISKNSLTPLIYGIIITILILFFETTGILNLKILTYILNPQILYTGYFPFTFVIFSFIINICLYFTGLILFRKIDF